MWGALVVDDAVASSATREIRRAETEPNLSPDFKLVPEDAGRCWPRYHVCFGVFARYRRYIAVSRHA
jgi:hypothetical protein